MVVVEVVVDGDDRPPVSAPVRVQVRDVGLADAPAVTVGDALGRVGRTGELLATVAIEVPQLPRHAAVWAHVDVDGDGRVSRGDFVTTARYAVPHGVRPRVRVTVRKVS